jgi:hypothetical protein
MWKEYGLKGNKFYRLVFDIVEMSILSLSNIGFLKEVVEK